MSRPRYHNVMTIYILVNGTSTNIFPLLFFSGQHTYGFQQDRQCTYKRNIESRSHSHCCRKNATTCTYSERVSIALTIQLAKSMRPIILSSVTCPAEPYFLTMSHKRSHFRKKKNTEYKICFTSFTKLVWNISHPKKYSAKYYHKCAQGVHATCPLFFSDFNKNNFFRQSSEKKFKHQISWKSVPWEPSLSMRTDRQIDTYDVTKLMLAFSQFCELV